MTCSVDTYRVVVGCFAGILVKILSSVIEPNPGPNPNNGTADMENENCSNNNGSTSATTQTTLEGLGNYMKSLMDTVTRLERAQSILVSDMDKLMMMMMPQT
ncbi:hypothetical protein BaRGS_00028093 [Batillaria attramentaria]|uniref:Uncharacterized protein n=1 Tax=Batillaria attramentaria TaxID=370345 RepID=A0ABD0JZU0_9CAEN